MRPQQARERAIRLRQRAAEMLGEAQALEAYAAEMERLGKAPAAPGKSQSHRLAISASLSSHDLSAQARRAGYSLRGLADACGVSHAYLSMVNSGRRAVPPELAAKLRELIGWRAPSDR